MNRIQILDCTLRDGGYANNWEFGFEAIQSIRSALDEIGVEFIELGFLRDEEYNRDRSVFDTVEAMGKLIGTKKAGTIYCGLVEMANYFPIEKLKVYSPEKPEAIRYSFWKRLMDDAYDYCRKIKEKGYKLCCQPTRVEQYTEKDFAELCKRFSELEPYGLYIVDTFGLLRKDDLVRYAQIGHEYLNPEIVLGYHAHDNLGQAFGNACAFIEQDYGERTIQIDASMFGMGRGAGNLKLEQILEHLNHKYHKNYNLMPIYRMWDAYLRKIHEEFPWGYELPYFIAASKECNPNYASYYMKKGYSTGEIYKIMEEIKGADKYLYSDEKAENHAKEAGVIK